MTGFPCNYHKSYKVNEVHRAFDHWRHGWLTGDILGDVSAQSLVGMVLPGANPNPARNPVTAHATAQPNPPAPFAYSQPVMLGAQPSAITTTAYYTSVGPYLAFLPPNTILVPQALAAVPPQGVYPQFAPVPAMPAPFAAAPAPSAPAPAVGTSRASSTTRHQSSSRGRQPGTSPASRGSTASASRSTA